MFSTKVAVIILGLLSALMVFDACAQWSPGGTMVYMGDLNLARSSATAGQSPYAIGSSVKATSPVNNSTANDTANNTSINGTAAMMPLDLSNYSRDRVNRNLAGYKNIMYPIAESRGSTASTAAGAGGCGCGG